MLKHEFGSAMEEETQEEIQNEQETGDGKIRFKIRYDYKGRPKPARFFFGGRDTEEMAEELREKNVALWRNVPVQGAQIEKVDLMEIYTIFEEEEEEEIAYAPLELQVAVDSLDDIVRFVARSEFRRLEVVEPENITLSKKEVERLLYKINETFEEHERWRKRGRNGDNI
ncbi:MAG: hypothetical protein ACOYBM_04745 [Dethiobacteria bacterium]|jgi:hypothetical protein